MAEKDSESERKVNTRGRRRDGGRGNIGGYGYVLPIIEKRLWFLQLLPLFVPNYFVPPNIFYKSTPV